MTTERPDLSDQLEFIKLDLASFEATKQFAERFKGEQRSRSLHILVNNAGIAYVPFGEQNTV